jgi:hypothetical protein
MVCVVVSTMIEVSVTVGMRIVVVALMATLAVTVTVGSSMSRAMRVPAISLLLIFGADVLIAFGTLIDGRYKHVGSGLVSPPF